VLAPVAALAVAATIAALLLAFRRELAGHVRATAPAPRTPHGPVMVKVLIVTVLLLAALFAGVEPAVAAMIAGAVLLVTRRIRPARVWVHVDWALLALFAGLFVVVRGMEATGWIERGLAGVPAGAHGSLAALAGVTTAISNLVSNVPAVLVLRSWAASHVNPEAAWLTIAMASTLAGNLTIVGSVANLIVIEQARDRASIGFWTYARVGVPLALATVAIGTAWVAWVTR
jgi:Na+/H+ antiporter NhaD/arsenite permease-like protein